MKGRPVVESKTHVEKNVRFVIDRDLHGEILERYLRKTFPEFRGIAIDFDYSSGDGSVCAHGWKETRKG